MLRERQQQHASMLPAQTLYMLMLLLHVLHQEHHQQMLLHQTLAKAPLPNPLCVKRRENGAHSFAAWGIV
jgi:hypothetical protein